MRLEILWLISKEHKTLTLKINNFKKKNIFVVNMWTLSLYNVIAPTVDPETFITKSSFVKKILTCQYLALSCIAASSRLSFVATFAFFFHQKLNDS